MRISYIIALLLLISCGTKKEVSSNGEMCTNAIIYGENDFNSLTEDDKIIFDQIMDSQSGMIVDLNAINELVCSSISLKRLAVRKISKRK